MTYGYETTIGGHYLARGREVAVESEGNAYVIGS